MLATAAWPQFGVLTARQNTSARNTSRLPERYDAAQRYAPRPNLVAIIAGVEHNAPLAARALGDLADMVAPHSNGSWVRVRRPAKVRPIGREVVRTIRHAEHAPHEPAAPSARARA